MTTATRTLPPHGSLSRRKNHRCGCDACLQRDRDYARERYRLKAYGRWQPFVDAEPVRAHLRMLMSYGIGWQRVARLAGLSNGGVSRILYGDSGRGLAPNKRVRTTTADKILAIRPVFDHLAPSRRVDATGTRRRLQGLVAVGWPQRRLATELGVHRAQLWQQLRKEDVEVVTARTVRDFYDRLWNVDPTTRGVSPQHAEDARQLAAAHQWAPPGAWDDDYIDSPAARPDLGEQVDRYSAIAEDAQWLIEEHGYTRAQAANRLGITKRHLERAFEHASQAAA